jgi:hypothetical protein
MFGFLKKEKKQTPEEQTPSLLEVGAKVFNYNPEYIRLNEQIITEIMDIQKGTPLVWTLTDEGKVIVQKEDTDEERG